MGLAPAGGLHEVLHHGWPNGTRHVVSGGADRDRDAAAAFEPLTDVGEKGREARRGAEEPDEDPMNRRELPNGSRKRGQRVADAEGYGADSEGNRGAETVGEPPHKHAAEGEADHGRRIGQGGAGPGDPELRFHGGEDHDDGPHTDPADRAEQNRKSEPPPGRGRVDAAQFAQRIPSHDEALNMPSPCWSMICFPFATENWAASSRLGWVSARMKRCSFKPSGKSFSMTPAV